MKDLSGWWQGMSFLWHGVVWRSTGASLKWRQNQRKCFRFASMFYQYFREGGFEIIFDYAAMIEPVQKASLRSTFTGRSWAWRWQIFYSNERELTWASGSNVPWCVQIVLLTAVEWNSKADHRVHHPEKYGAITGCWRPRPVPLLQMIAVREDASDSFCRATHCGQLKEENNLFF